MQEDTSFRGDVIGLCILIKGRHTEGKGRHQRGLSLLKPYYLASTALSTFHLFKPIQELNSALLHTLKHVSFAANYVFMQANRQLFTGLATKGF